MEGQTFRSLEERVYGPADDGGCGTKWTTAVGEHMCSRPASHGGLHRCIEGCWWFGDTNEYLVFSLREKKWFAEGMSGYVDQVELAGRFDKATVHRVCERHASPMREWRPVPAPAGPSPMHHPLPAIYLSADSVQHIVADPDLSLEEAITAAASLQIPGWSAYWREVGEVYDPCR